MARRRKVTASEPMSEETKQLLAENREVRKAEQEAERLEKMRQQHEESAASTARRRARLAHYVARVLKVKGRERLRFFEQHPIESIFD